MSQRASVSLWFMGIYTLIKSIKNKIHLFFPLGHIYVENMGKLVPFRNLGPVVQSIVSLTSLLVVKMLTVLVSTISN